MALSDSTQISRVTKMSYYISCINPIRGPEGYRYWPRNPNVWKIFLFVVINVLDLLTSQISIITQLSMSRNRFFISVPENLWNCWSMNASIHHHDDNCVNRKWEAILFYFRSQIRTHFYCYWSVWKDLWACCNTHEPLKSGSSQKPFLYLSAYSRHDVFPL